MGLFDPISSNAIIAITWSIFTFSLILTVMRFIHKSGVNLINGLILLSFLGLLGYAILGTILMTDYVNFSSQAHDIFFLLTNMDNVVRLAKMSFAVQFLNHTVLYIIKAAFLALYYPIADLRLFWTRVLFWGSVGYVAACGISTMLLQLLYSPIQSNWDLSDMRSPFWERPFIISTTVLNISSDLVVMCFPLIMISRLTRLGHTARTALGVVLFMGLFSIFASVVRVVIAWKMSGVVNGAGSSGAVGYTDPMEVVDAMAYYSEHGYTVGMWQGLEIWAAYVGVCTPDLRKAIVHWWPWWHRFGSGLRSSASNRARTLQSWHPALATSSAEAINNVDVEAQVMAQVPESQRSRSNNSNEKVVDQWHIEY